MNRNRKHNKQTSIADVARHAGVSTATVSRVINQTGTVSPKTAAVVTQAVKDLDYRPQKAAQVLAGQKTATLGVLLKNIHGDFTATLLGGIEAKARALDYNLLIQSTGHENGTLTVGMHNTDGLLVVADALNDNTLRKLYQAEFPTVLVHRSTPPETTFPSVTIENRAGVRQMVDHLVNVHHCKRIAWLRGSSTQEDATLRYQGYLESLQAHSLPYDQNLVGVGDFDREVAFKTVSEWLAAGRQFDAIFADDDEAALGALDALRTQSGGPQTPVVGFDDTRLAQFVTPRLTTVHAPTAQVGAAAAERLITLVRTGNAQANTKLSTRLVIRESCGCNPAATAGK